MAGRTLEVLREQYTDDTWRERFVAYCSLMDLLGDCLIADDYKVSDRLNQAIALTDAGTNTRNRLARKEGVPVKDANLMCALTIGHDELYIDVEGVVLDDLATAIDCELMERRIQFPFVFGRQLYDRYAKLFEDEKSSLTRDETARLLDGMPIGVCQYGHYTTGPFGLRASPMSRYIRPGRRVPAYHCAKLYCDIVHPTYLDTSNSASINKNRAKLEDYLQSLEAEPAEWWPLADDLAGRNDIQYRDERSGTFVPLIGDCLNDDELKHLISYLLDNTGGTLRSELAAFTAVRSADDFTESLDRASLLQVALLCSETDLGRALDTMVRENQIVVPRGDIRRPVVNSAIVSGAFHLRGELGHLGARLASDEPGFALLRERRLLNKLYVRESSHADIHELEWQLREVDIQDLDERLEHFFRTVDPRKALERLVLSRKTNMVTACHDAGIEDGDDLNDRELIDTILWKLGFPLHSEEDFHSEFWKRHEVLWALAQSSEIGASSRFNEQAGPYFSQLEGILLDSLAFTCWALTFDHTAAEFPFTYDDTDDRLRGLSTLSGTPENVGLDYTSKRVTLEPLTQGFARLASILAKYSEDPEAFKRSEAEIPSYHGKTDLKEFLMVSKVPFLDLSSPSRERILSALKEITDVLVRGGVCSFRNDYTHYRRNAPDIEKVEAGLEATRNAVTRIETFGFSRMPFTRSSVSIDEWGQSRHEFQGPRSFNHTLTRPSRFDWMNMPSLQSSQYLLRSASYGDQREVLRFSLRHPSAFSRYWKGVPSRRRRGVTTIEGEEVANR